MTSSVDPRNTKYSRRIRTESGRNPWFGLALAYMHVANSSVQTKYWRCLALLETKLRWQSDLPTRPGR